MAITGQGQASKEQVAAMLQRLLHIQQDEMPKFMDATDALGAAYCHFLADGTARRPNAKHIAAAQLERLLAAQEAQCAPRVRPIKK